MSSPAMAPKGPKVSPARTIVSLILLAVVGVVCLIEMRAGLGQYLSGKKLKQALGSEDSAATQKTMKFAEAKALLSMGPTEEMVRETPYEKVYRYSWYSFLRPLIGEQNPQIFISASAGEEAIATGFFTSDDEQPGAGYVYQNPPGGASGGSPPPLPLPPMGGAGGPGGPGGMRMPGGGPGQMMGPPGGGSGRKRPALEDEEKETGDDEKAAAGDASVEEGEKPAADGTTTPADAPKPEDGGVTAPPNGANP
ncbi:MAG: hypothetical protein RLZZ436_4130 [Planctomycetota bacterium]